MTAKLKPNVDGTVDLYVGSVIALSISAIGDISIPGALSVAQDLSVAQALSVDSSNTPSPRSPVGGDLLINADGRFIQRGSASTSDTAYRFDRWKVLTQTAAITPSQLADAADGTPFMMRLTQAQASAQRMGTCQYIEDIYCKKYRGGTVTLSVKHKISSNANIRIAIVEWTGTANSITNDPINDWTSGTYTAGNFFVSSNFTIRAVSSAIASTSALATATLTATLGSTFNNLYVIVWTEGTAAQNVTLDLACKLEPGSVETPMVQRDYTEELSLCQRYCETFSSATGEGGVYAVVGVGWVYAPSNSILLSRPFSTTKRTIPTLTYSALADFAIYGGSTLSSLYANSGGSTKDNIEIGAQDNGSIGTMGICTRLNAANTTAARLTFDSEL